MPDDPLFACHMSRDGQETVCAGWLYVHGHDHVGARLRIATGTLRWIDPDDTWPEMTDEPYAQMVDRVAGPPGTCRIPVRPPLPPTTDQAT